MTEAEAKKTAESIVIAAAQMAEKKGVARDRCAATLTEAGVLLMIREVGPMGAAEIIRQMADKIELNMGDAAGHA